MQAAQQLPSCIPCAKRKVRCDRGTPCFHCKRRRGDICTYPAPTGARMSRLTSHIQRIEQLEQYIRDLGGDPGLVQQSLSSTAPSPASDECPNLPGLAIRIGVDEEATKTSRWSDTAKLVEVDEQTVYIETPMWQRWSEATTPASELPKSSGSEHTGYSSTIFDPDLSAHTTSLKDDHPSSQRVMSLWTRFLSNVHPVCRLFFDWDKANVLQKAAKEPEVLSKAEHAFAFSVYFITILSLSERECEVVMGDSGKSQLLDKFQSLSETALLAAGFMATSELILLQALMLHLLAIRNRVRSATMFSLMGIAIRIAQRIGLHRDGSLLGLSLVQTEERRRTWWGLQHMEIIVSQNLGSVSLTLYAEWDTKLPSNLEDTDFHHGMQKLPPDRRGLTGMSDCLWRYDILRNQRTPTGPTPADGGIALLTSLQKSMSAKEVLINQIADMLSEKYVRYCELLNPLHVHIQIGIRLFILAVRRVALQPEVSKQRVSEISRHDRDAFLKNCIEILEYYILAETTTSIAHFSWHREFYFQWAALVYVMIEAHHRAASSEADTLWLLIEKIFHVHPKLVTRSERPDIVAIGRLIGLAWNEREDHLSSLDRLVERPSCVSRMMSHAQKMPVVDDDSANWADFDFDMIDWQTWEQDGYLGVLT